MATVGVKGLTAGHLYVSDGNQLIRKQLIS